MRPRANIALLALVVLVSTATPAAAQETPPGRGVSITPSRVELDLEERGHDFEVKLANTTDGVRLVRVAIAALGHDLDGAPIFEPVQGTELSIEGPTEFELAPGESRSLQLSADFPDQVALYRGVVATVEDPNAPNRAVTVETRVASLVLLRGPRPWDQTIRPRVVGGSTDGEDGPALWVDVENVGDAHVRPAGTLQVLRNGEEVAQVTLEGENIIPGYARRLLAPWTPPSGGEEDEFVVRVTFDGGETIEGPVSFATDEGPATSGAGDEQQEQSGGAAFGGGVQRSPLWLAIAVVLLLITSIALVLVWVRRRRDEEEEDERVVATGTRV